MIQLTSLFPDLVLLVPACPEPTMERALRDAARQFCRDTYVITRTSDAVNTVANEPLVELQDIAESGEEIVAVLQTIVDGLAAFPIPRDWLRGKIPTYMATESSRPVGTYLEGEARLKLWPTPDAVYSVQFIVATAPNSTALQFDDDLGSRWKEPIIGKATAILAAHVGTSYSNPQMVVYGLQQYRLGVGKARVELNRSYGRSTHVIGRGDAWL